MALSSSTAPRCSAHARSEAPHSRGRFGTLNLHLYLRLGPPTCSHFIRVRHFLLLAFSCLGWCPYLLLSWAQRGVSQLRAVFISCLWRFVLRPAAPQRPFASCLSPRVFSHIAVSLGTLYLPCFLLACSLGVLHVPTFSSFVLAAFDSLLRLLASAFACISFLHISFLL